MTLPPPLQPDHPPLLLLSVVNVLSAEYAVPVAFVAYPRK